MGEKEQKSEKEEEEQEWKSIKVKEGVYEDLKRMGVGIGKAVEILAAQQKELLGRKIEDVKELGSDIAEIMLEHGIFDIKFAGVGIQEVKEEGEMIQIRGFVKIIIANEEARKKVIETLAPREEEEEEEEESG